MKMVGYLILWLAILVATRVQANEMPPWLVGVLEPLPPALVAALSWLPFAL